MSQQLPISFQKKMRVENITNKAALLVDQDKVAQSAGAVLLIFYCLIFIFGFFGKGGKRRNTRSSLVSYSLRTLGNSMVIYVAIRKKNYRNVTNCYVINLAIADLCFLTLSIPYTTYLGMKSTDPFGDTVCKIYTYLAYVRKRISSDNCNRVRYLFDDHRAFFKPLAIV